MRIYLFIPPIAFWFLDSFYLQLERKYKILYKRVSDKSEGNIDFNMDITGISYTNDENNYRCGRSNGVDIDTDVKRELFGLLELVIGRFKKQEIVIKKEPDASGSFKA